MKKLVGAIIVCVLIAGGAYLYLQSKVKSVGALEGITPDNAYYYISAYNPVGRIKKLEASAFYQQLSSARLFDNFKQTSIQPFLDRMPFIKEIASKDVAVAIYTVPRLAPYEAQEFLFLARVDASRLTSAKKALADFYLRLTKQKNTASRVYRGVTIFEYTLPNKGMVISHALIGDVLAVATTKSIIERTVDLAKGISKDSLRNDRIFQKALAKARKDDLVWLYVNSGSYFQETINSLSASAQGEGLTAAETVGLLNAMKPFLTLMGALDGQGVYLAYDDAAKGVVFRSFQFLSPNKDGAKYLESFFLDSALEDNVLSIIPRDVIGYYAQNYDIGRLWGYFKELFGSFEQLASSASARSNTSAGGNSLVSLMEQLKNIEAYLEINVENDFLPILANTAGVVFVDLKDAPLTIGASNRVQGSVQPKPIPLLLPKFYAFMEVKDPGKMDELMQGIFTRIVEKVNQAVRQQAQQTPPPVEPAAQGQPVEQPSPDMLAMSTEQYEDVTIQTIEPKQLPVDFLRPSFCVLGKYLVFSLSPGILKEVIRVYTKEDPSFAANTHIAPADVRGISKASMVAYFEPAKLVDKLRSSSAFSNALLVRAAGPQKSGASAGDVEMFLDFLSRLSSCVFASGKVDSETLETTGAVSVEGL